MNRYEESTAARLERMCEIKKEGSKIGFTLAISTLLMFVLSLLFYTSLGIGLAVCSGLTIVIVLPLLYFYGLKKVANVVFVFLSAAVFVGLLLRSGKVSLAVFASLALMYVLFWLFLRTRQLWFAIIAVVILVISLYFLFFYNIGSLPANSVVYSQLVYSICDVFSLAFPFLFLLKFKDDGSGEIINFAAIKPKMLLAFLGIGMAFSIFGHFLNGVIKNNLKMIGLEYSSPKFQIGKSLTEMLFSGLVTALVPAILEEFVFRGVILGRLRKFGNSFAVFFSAIMFGLFHANLSQIPFAFILGLLFGVLTIETNSMLPAMLVHFANNFWAVSFDIATDICGEAVFPFYYVFSQLTFVAFGLWGIIYILKRKPNFLGNKSTGALVSMRDCMVSSFKSPGIVVALLLIAVEIILFGH